MQIRRILLTALVVLLVMASCVLIIRVESLQTLLRDGLITPLVYLFWLAGLALRAIDQAVLWGAGIVLLALALFFGLYITRSGDAGEPRGRRWQETAAPQSSGRLRFWSFRIKSLRYQGLHSDYAMHDFSRLGRAASRFVGQDLAESAAARLPVLRSFFTRHSTELPPHTTWWEGLRRRFAAFFHPNPAPDQAVALPEFCTFLEEILEIDHDQDH
jgi:hypothetical protein